MSQKPSVCPKCTSDENDLPNFDIQIGNIKLKKNVLCLNRKIFIPC